MVSKTTFPLIYSSDNVIPLVKKITAESMVDDFYCDLTNHPSFISLHKVTGCFNSVVQVASAYSLSLFHHQLSPPLLVKIITPDDLVDFAQSQQEPFESGELNKLFSNFEPEKSYAIVARLIPKDIAFSDDRKITIGYRLDFSVMSRESRGTKGKLLAKPVMFFRGTNISKTLGHFTDVARLGYSVLSINTTYGDNVYPDTKRVDIFADMVNANTLIQQPKGDLKRVYDHFLFSDFPNALNALLIKPRIYLTPTISLVGQNPVNVPVVEITDFQVSVFHLTKDDKQALVAGFSVMPGNRGIVEEVKHFIGAKDYGVISDEYLIERIFKHKWNRGGFLRKIGWRNMVNVKLTDQDGNVSYEDALLSGYLNLETLLQVTIDTNSNTRTDYIRLGGLASAVPVWMWVYLEGGGQSVTVDPDQVELGDWSNIPWALHTSIDVQAALSEESETRDFQKQATEDGYQHIAKPFANAPFQLGSPVARAVYTRIEGVTKQVFVLGEFNDVFL